MKKFILILVLVAAQNSFSQTQTPDIQIGQIIQRYKNSETICNVNGSLVTKQKMKRGDQNNTLMFQRKTEFTNILASGQEAKDQTDRIHGELVSNDGPTDIPYTLIKALGWSSEVILMEQISGSIKFNNDPAAKAVRVLLEKNCR